MIKKGFLYVENLWFGSSGIMYCTCFSACTGERLYYMGKCRFLNIKVKPAFTLSGKLEWRTKDDLGKTDRWGLDVGGAYSVLPFLKVAAGYEIHYRNRGEAGWKFRHRYHFDGTLPRVYKD